MSEWLWEETWLQAYHLKAIYDKEHFPTGCFGSCAFSRVATILIAAVSDIPKELRYV